MILRKPYAFLIKHFKLIHLIMALCMGILLYQTTILQNFFNEFAGSTQVIVDSNVGDVLIKGYIYIFPIIIIVMSLVVLVLMSLKNKPRFYYLITIVSYIALIILYAYSSTIIGNMQREIVDERIVRAIRDFFNIAFIVQLYTLFISIIRSIGIDLKKFDFREDYEELDLNANDNEEFEVNIEFDSQTLKRNFKRQYRDFRYYFIENKYIILTILAIMVIIFIGIVVNNITSTTKKYSMNEVFNVTNYNIAIENAYLTESKADKSLVIVKFKIRSLNKGEKFVFGKLALQINQTKYYHNNLLATSVKDLGTSYINQELNENFQEYILIYEIPSSVEANAMKVVYTEQLVKGMFKSKTDDKVVPLSITNLKEEKDSEEIVLNQEYIIGGGLLNGYELKFNNLELGSSYNINYNVCVKGNECYNYYEVVQPSLTGNVDMAVLKVSGDMVVPDNGNIKTIDKLITTFGNISYTINGVQKTQAITKYYTPARKDNNYYFEVNKEILSASEVSLELNVRNNKYIIKIK